ncbi:MAG: DUF1549 and DUF1553 domain-containing protein [Verrucomicrobiales bacterium]|nr:DUF1549 and DUF1553 domain-containing protein [Verrucomicrobiales bacterium]
MKRKEMSKTMILSLVGGLLLASPMAVDGRVWKDKKGHEVEADYVGYEKTAQGLMVKLKSGEGAIKLPFAQLSPADQAYVKKQAAAQAPVLSGTPSQKIDQMIMIKLKAANAEIRTRGAALSQEKGLSKLERKKKAEELVYEEKMTIPNKRMSDQQFVRRVYLDIAGRIPTYNEAVDFLEGGGENKRAKLIDELLDSEANVMHMFNWYSDLLRIRDGVVMGAGGQLKVIGYADWVKDSIRENKPFDKMVQEMLTATGTLWDNPATGYLITDNGMPLCNLSNTFTVFLGTEITCAQCHDHPFEEVYQMDFYKMASFFGETNTRGGGGGMMAMGKGKDLRAERNRLNKLLEDGGKLRKDAKTDNQLNNILGTYAYNVSDGGGNKVKLPHDYKYDDADPSSSVIPAAYFGEKVDVKKYETPRKAFAEWMTSKENPRFTVNLVNRLWKRAFGLAQIEPVDNIPGDLGGQAQNKELLTFLQLTMQDLDFDVKGFMRILYNTNAYQREACHVSPTLTQIDRGEYHFAEPILRRMTAEQLWDSLVALTTSNPESMQRRGLEDYQTVMNTDLSTLKTADDVLNYKKRFYAVGAIKGMSGEMGSKEAMAASKVGGVQMVRASELQLPQRPGSFLRMFGQSNKQLIENNTTLGSTPQVMALLNGKITNQVLTNAKAHLVNEVVNNTRGKGGKTEKIFMSILGRFPTSAEKSAASSGMRVSKDKDKPMSKEAKEVAKMGNVIWALLNTREFLFIQ